MKAMITVNQNAALLAGVDNQGSYTLQFSPSALTLEQRQELTLSKEYAAE